MKRFIIKVLSFYVEGFRQMRLGKLLWLIIIIKLFVMFFILKLFFFPDFLGHLTQDEKQEFVYQELINRSQK